MSDRPIKYQDPWMRDHAGKRGISGTRPSDCSSSVKVRRGYDGWGVQFSVGVQHFDVGPQDYEIEREAEWMATMFRNALRKMNASREA